MDKKKTIIDKKTGEPKEIREKHLTFRNSYSIIPAPLRDFANLFKLLTHKEIISYKIYTEENIKRQMIPFSEFYDQCEEHGITYSTKPSKAANQLINTFKGITIEEMKESAKNHNINVNIYEYDNNKTFSALLYSKDKIIHIMYIIDAEALTNIHICPHCGSYIHKGNNNIDRYKRHVEKCDGKFKKDFIPSREALPYCPHILNNPVYLYCLSYDLEWFPTIHYITYDFETMEQKIEKKVSDKSVINSQLIPLNVSSCVKLDKGLINIFL